MLAGQPYIICEINTSHFGNIESALRAVEIAKASGASAIKFQSFSSESLYSKAYLEANSVAARLFDKFSLSAAELRLVSQRCLELGLDFGSTVYSDEEVRELGECEGLSFVKIASMDFLNKGLIECAAGLNVPLVLSTGMATHSELLNMANWLQSSKIQATILHCVSLYPTPLEKVALGNIPMIREMFPQNQVGFSDHTLGSVSSSVALALGASVIEKHMTLDKSRPGMDNEMAMDASEFSTFVSTLRTIYASIQLNSRELTTEEIEQALKMRRSAHSTRDLLAGEVLVSEDLYFARPGSGIQLQDRELLLGRVVTQGILKDELISWESVGGSAEKHEHGVGNEEL